MWLTGFEVPSLHTMYLDKPMQGHGLMQAIARVNRVFKDKPGGLVVDYLGLAEQLRLALADYTARDRKDTAIPQEQAVGLLLERHEIVRDLFHGFDYSGFFPGTAAQRMRLLAGADDFILADEDRKKRLPGAVSVLLKTYALAVPDAQALRLQDRDRLLPSGQVLAAEGDKFPDRAQRVAGVGDQRACLARGRLG